ncbi:glycosyltransferase family protein [Flavobacterium poyangense]|uniref:hypothetical protein n=1 Tax=Flavobacterium poyangense TaxID=2204302 RepID=UPI00141EC2C0|nr:hypothetical protein [Flavobacterium sp. JXAS1]
MIPSITTSKISVLAFFCSEACTITELIKNVSFAHEIILINTGTDSEATTAKEKPGVTIVQQTISDKTLQQNVLINEAQNDWILLLDQNEYISPELRDEILTKISKPESDSIFYIKQTLHFFEKKLRYGEFNHRKKVFLFNKKKQHFLNHQKSKPFLTTLFRKSSVLKNRIDSYGYKNFDEYNHQLSLKSKEEAIILFKKNMKPNIYHFFLKPFLNFINQYFKKLGFLDGKEGYVLAYINSFAVLKRYLILWLLHHKME